MAVTRDRKALFLLLAMMAACFALMAAYFLTSRTWNVAATILDDRAGQMDDYTVLAFSGVVPQTNDQAGASSSGEKLFVSDVRGDYEESGAVVLTLDLEHLSAYAEPVIFEGSGRSIGVFSLERAVSEKQLDAILEDLSDQGAQTVVCLTKRPAYLPVTDGVDVVILSENDPDYSGTGQLSNDTFIVSSPEEGSIGAVVVTASNVASARIFVPKESSSQK